MEDDRNAPTLLVDDGSAQREPGETFRRGAKVEHYLVLDEIGRGGMSVVFRAYDARLHREVALKALRPGVDPVGPERMLREARAMARLAHPNVVPVYDVGTTEGRAWVAMELVEGRDLSRWLAERDRGVDEILQVLLAAGRGLAAAHEKSLVHRDFKPGNVLVGDTGRVRVSDFGLVRGVGSIQPERRPQRQDASDEAHDELTQSGSVVGTPRYMPPEQHAGDPVDARGDQFAFCVTAWEALFGEAPFPSGPEGRKAKRAHRLADPPARRGVPTRVRDALVVGLSPDPERRWPSMNALLTELDPAPRAARRRRIYVGAGLLSLSALAVVAHELRPPEMGCESGAEQLAEIWSEARNERIARAFAGLDVVGATGAWSRAASLVDRYGEQWTAARRQACEATRVEQAQSATVLDLRNDCLDDRLRRLDAQLAVFETPDDAMVRRAVQAASGLASVQPCSDVDYLQARVPPPTDATVAQRVEALRELRRQADAQEAAGHYDMGVELMQRALTDARTVDYPPMLAELLRRRGSLAMQRGQYDEAVPLLREAYGLAAGSRHDEVAVEAAIDLSFATSTSSHYEAGERWLEHARMMIEAAALPAWYEARRMDRLGNIRTGQGRHEQALQAHIRARDLLAGASEPNPQALAGYEMHIGIALSDLGRPDEALEHYETSLRMHEERLGSDHPNVAVVLINIGNLHNEAERWDDALATLGRADRIVSSGLGATHPYVGFVRLNRAVALAGKDDHDGAIELAESALEVHIEAFGRKHPRTARALFNLGLLHEQAGHASEARALLDQSLAIDVELVGEDAETVVETRRAIAELFGDEPSSQ